MRVSSRGDYNGKVDNKLAKQQSKASVKVTAYTFGNGTDDHYTFTHGRNTRDVIIQVYEISSGDLVPISSASRTANSVTLHFALPIDTNSCRAVIIG